MVMPDEGGETPVWTNAPPSPAGAPGRPTSHSPRSGRLLLGGVLVVIALFVVLVVVKPFGGSSESGFCHDARALGHPSLAFDVPSATADSYAGLASEAPNELKIDLTFLEKIAEYRASGQTGTGEAGQVAEAQGRVDAYVDAHC